MSRLTALVTRLENVSKKLGMELEDVISILEGTHKTHTVTVNVVPTKPALAANPTISGPVAASGAPATQAAAGSTAAVSASVAAQNLAAAGAKIQD